MISHRSLVPAITAAIVFTLAIVLPFTGCGLPVTGLPNEIADGGMICNNPAQCDDHDQCTTETCDNGVCGHVPVAQGPGPEQTAGDCKTVRCDGAGVASEVNDDQDIIKDTNDCTIDACKDGVATHDNAPEMTPCMSGALSGLCVGGMCAVTCTSDMMCDDMNPCTTDACDGTTGLCANTSLNGVLTPGAPVVKGDCRAHVCVEGVDTNSPDDSDLPDDKNECHLQQCNLGTPAFPPVGLNAPCGPSGTRFCDGADACVECNEAGQCPGTTDDCKTITCAAKACGVTFAAINTPVSAQVLHDCHDIVCDGAGNISPIPIVKDADTPDDGNDCTFDVCAAGVASHSNHPVGDPCGNGAACAVGGVCGCTNNAQCVSPNTCGGGLVPFICGCAPKSCAQVNATCGPMATDGCFATQNCDNGKDGAETDVDCGGGGACVTKCGNSKACKVDSDCASAHCADGVCCNTACDGTCQACTAAKSGGSDGVCGSIPANSPDNAPVCSGNNACDGNNSCKKISGQACGAGSDCVSGSCAGGFCCNVACSGTCDASGACKKNNGEACALNSDCLNNLCVDGYCCNSACTGTCMQCDKAGSLGTCSNVASGQTDMNASMTCLAPSACDGNGGCKKANGQTCGKVSDCASGICVDGVCCLSACLGTCQACNIVGSLGTCSDLASGQNDSNATVPCTGGANACDGAGNCKKANGQACAQDSDCGSTTCADGVCCNSACAGACQACTAMKKGGGADGACGDIAKNLPDDAPVCSGASVCDGAGHCEETIGQTCAQNSDCLSAFCADAVCCNNACAGTCQACSAAKKGGGQDGACGNIAVNLADDAPVCSGSSACDGGGNCRKALGQTCAQNNECASNTCADNVCCNSGCGNKCQACTAMKKGGGQDGTCGNIAVNLPDDAPSCSGNSACDGAGACKLASGQPCAGNNALCASGSCHAGTNVCD